MLDYFCIFTKGGALLWTWQQMALRGSPVDALIRTCLLEERSGESSFTYKPPTGAAYTLKWTLHNGLGLVFVAVYQSTLKLLYVDELLERVKQEFVQQYKPKGYQYDAFQASFQKALHKAENRVDISKQAGQAPQRGLINRKGGGRKQGVANGHDASQQSSEEASEDGDTDTSSRFNSTTNLNGLDQANGKEDTDEHEEGEGADGAFDVSKIKGKLAKRPPKGVGAAKKEKAAKDKAKGEPKKKEKVKRTWGGSGKLEESEVLDYSEQVEGHSGSDDGVNRVVADLTQVSLVDKDDSGSEASDEEDEVVASEAAGRKGGGGGGFLSSFVRSIGMSVVGTASLTEEDIAPALEQLRRKLMERNVANEIAGKLCESVATNLVGQRLSGFTGITKAVRSAVEEALTRILTPRRSIDILREVHAARQKGKPYTIVFVGVNGVGKSTNLSKVAYWLLQNDMKVMIAACDTFRSGAVEQLKTHCNRLNIPLYERGYEKDPAKVAFEAAKQAERAKCDVLLVDTAGRMQDNEPLMRALSNLISMNEPDLVLFVGEALVGNDAVDQLTKFNQRLLDLAKGSKAHAIDGILLTKFDTIDEKVGAALSMVYTSGAPIMFVGCGQTYVDLKRLNVKSVVRSLLK